MPRGNNVVQNINISENFTYYVSFRAENSTLYFPACGIKN